MLHKNQRRINSMRLNMKMGMVVSRERLEGERWWWLGVMTNITSGHTGGAPLSIGGTPLCLNRRKRPATTSPPGGCESTPTSIWSRVLCCSNIALLCVQYSSLMLQTCVFEKILPSPSCMTCNHGCILVKNIRAGEAASWTDGWSNLN